MFTGLVEHKGSIAAIQPRQGGARMSIRVGPSIAGEASLGESIAINGCCLTVTDIDVASSCVSFDLLEQTLRVTSLGDLAPGDPVNVERALAVGARLGGHFVQGHVDDAVEILAWGPAGADYRLEIALPAGARGLVIPKGSICLDGISLTADEVLVDRVVCWIIPQTLEHTHLSHKKAGQRMNVEWDMLGKYVRALLHPAV